MKVISSMPRETIFGAPDKTFVQISPKGAHTTYLAPLDGVHKVWVALCLSQSRPRGPYGHLPRAALLPPPNLCQTLVTGHKSDDSSSKVVVINA